MPFTLRAGRIQSIFPDIKPFRLKQIETALFDPSIRSWKNISTLPKDMRETLEREVPFLSARVVSMLNDKNKETFKAVVEVQNRSQSRPPSNSPLFKGGGNLIETVLMKNKRGYWTICVSTQVGCAMACSFCATGKMGLTRNLDAEEIVDQVRLWQQFLYDHKELEQRMSNIVYMGMGEPLANYENTKASLNTILAQTDIGNTHITVSTVGVLPRLEQILTDKDWPHVRLAVSLHSADAKTRKDIVRTSYEDFLPKLDDWARRYLKKFDNRRHHLTFEYVMLKGVNDSPEHAKKLAVYVNRIGNIRVNLIPFNFIETEFAATDESELNRFQEILFKNGVTVTVRRSKGQDIAAACGQLIKQQ